LACPVLDDFAEVKANAFTTVALSSHERRGKDFLQEKASIAALKACLMPQKGAKKKVLSLHCPCVHV
jgi:hypothetical protein